MRFTLMASAAVLGLALSAPSFAQTVQSSGMQSPTNNVGRSERNVQSRAIVGRGEPYSPQASNIDRADTSSDVAPQLPVPPVGDSASPQVLLRTADMDLARGRTGAAQEALERAETRLLDARANPAPANGAPGPVNGPMIDQINRALQAIGHNDIRGARTIVASAIGNAGPMNASNMTNNNGMSMSNGAMNSGMNSGNMDSGSMNGPNTGGPMNGTMGTGMGSGGRVGNGISM